MHQKYDSNIWTLVYTFLISLYYLNTGISYWQTCINQPVSQPLAN